MTHDGHTIMEFFKFGTDREEIGPFVGASYGQREIYIFLFMNYYMSVCVRKPTIYVSTRSDTSRAVQSQEMV